MSAVSPLVIFIQPVHGTRNFATPTTISQPTLDNTQQAVNTSCSDSSVPMLTLVSHDNAQLSVDYWRWDF
jgi:hypothetical protein